MKISLLFEDENLIGLATYFRLPENLVTNTNSPEVTKKLVDYVLRENPDISIEVIACFKKNADIMLQRLKEKHKRTAKKTTQEQVMILNYETFHDFTKGNESIATKDEIDQIIMLGRMLNNRDLEKPITEKERKRICVKEEFVLRENKKIISVANIHGVSKDYFQIGGVITHPEYRNKGHSTQVMSFLCKHFFNQGKKKALLFTSKTNYPAQSVYKKLGFEIVNDFVIAEF